MTYSDFTLKSVCASFGLLEKHQRLFEHIAALEVPPRLAEELADGLALPLTTEKARSEFIVVPILLNVRHLTSDAFYMYSGHRLDVDPAKGLVGECDFILTNTPRLLTIQAPIITIVEAKKHDVEAGLGQCAAQMVGARLFNQQEGNTIETIFGCVTTGEIWQFLKLEGSSMYIDTDRYFIDNVGLILGILQAIVAWYKDGAL